MALGIDNKDFWDTPKVEAEFKRVFDICNGCRRCYNLCPSFNDMFARLDSEPVDGDAEKLGATDFRSVTDLCYQCKLCFNHCPYTPPHRWEIDFPRLMLRAKATQVKREGIPLHDRMLGKVDLMGRIGTYSAPLSNWAIRNPVGRWLLEKLCGIHRNRLLPEYASETFRRWFDRRPRAQLSGGDRKAVLFYTCNVNFNDPAVGKACVRVLEKNRVHVQCPEQRCCGMPFLDGGDIEATRASARANIESLYSWVREGYDVVIPGPTCSYMLKREYPTLVDGEKVRAVAARTYDICEYLMGLHRDGKLDTGFVRGVGQVAYQIPCHLRAQNIGYKSRDLMELVPNTTVRLIEKCSAIDGTWGLKEKYYDLSRKVAEPLVREIRESRADFTASDCPLAGLQIQEGSGKRTLHPVQVVAIAYGLEEERGR
ncbi:MAG: anaerobic glycerol-3-phosphate dehydrogenase subunit C [Deltaproteobacteria bacterium]|nr:anaerobic glycerol-3-phosphate dehydrogenase subunit C [Deltaproteobacteria bacterium]